MARSGLFLLQAMVLVGRLAPTAEMGYEVASRGALAAAPLGEDEAMAGDEPGPGEPGQLPDEHWERPPQAEAVAIREPPQPSAEERGQQRLTHTPWAAWCTCCIRGGANDEPHRKLVATDRLPAVQLDDCFLKRIRQRFCSRC